MFGGKGCNSIPQWTRVNATLNFILACNLLSWMLTVSFSTIAFLTPLIPFLSAFIIGFYRPFLSLRAVEYLSLALLTLTAACSYYLFSFVSFDTFYGECGHVLYYPFSWATFGVFDIRWSLFYDSLTVVMFVVVSTISLMVHLYSLGYMAADPHKPLFLAYLGLFTSFMLILVSAGNFIQLFIGWEGVGLCSYLLIGFWSSRLQANKAAIKALVLNKVGDCALLFSFALMVYSVGTLDLSSLLVGLPLVGAKGFVVAVGGYYFSLVEVICLTLFLGAMAKSAQIGLHTWLPDAMEGPTPVSALIHAATMVTAGVFLVIRCAPLFEFAPRALLFVTFIGGLTALFGASVAIVQYDIKKVIAYSTCSQLGYMIFACGLANYSGALFHLSTHAFFKSLLFLGAGSVIHACADEQDLRRMGGLRRILPFSYTIMMVGSLALAGFPFLSGFYSKDLIIEAAWATSCGAWGGTFAYTLGVVVALLTGCYSFRLLYHTFYGSAWGVRSSRLGVSRAVNSRKSAHQVPHEASWDMGGALALLAFGSIFVGALSVVYFDGLAYTWAVRGESVCEIFYRNLYPPIVDLLGPKWNPNAGALPYLHMVLPYYTQVVITGGVSFLGSCLGALGWLLVGQYLASAGGITSWFPALGGLRIRVVCSWGGLCGLGLILCGWGYSMWLYGSVVLPFYLPTLALSFLALLLVSGALYNYEVGSAFLWSRPCGLPDLRHFLVNRWYFDHFYNFALSLTTFTGGYRTFQRLDKGWVEFFGPGGVALALQSLSRRFSGMQTGYLYDSAFHMVVGMVFVLLLVEGAWFGGNFGEADCAFLWGVMSGRWVTDPHAGPSMPHPYDFRNSDGGDGGEDAPTWVRGDWRWDSVLCRWVFTPEAAGKWLVKGRWESKEVDIDYTTSHDMYHPKSNTTTTTTVTTTVTELIDEFIPLVGYEKHKGEEVVSLWGTWVSTQFFEPGPGAVRCYYKWVFIPGLGGEVMVEGIWKWREVDTDSTISDDMYHPENNTSTTTTVTFTITEPLPEFVPLVGYGGGVEGGIDGE